MPGVINLPSHNVNEEHLYSVIDSEIDKLTLAGHHLQNFNSVGSTGINQIVTQLFQVEKTMPNERTKTPEDNEIGTIHFVVKFTDVKISKPTTPGYVSGKSNLLMPNLARKHNLNYSSSLMVDAVITAKAFPKDGSEPRIRTEEVKNYKIAAIPIMVGSQLCHTYGLGREDKRHIEEDPNDPGGYFILKGGEWVVSMIETRLFNYPHIFHNVGHEKEVARLEFISKPGDAYENSSELIMRYVTNGNIYLTFTSNPYLKMLNIPFYIIFRLLGMTTDKEIIDNIIYGYSSSDEPDVISDHMLQILKTAFHAGDADFGDSVNITDQAKLLEYFSKRISFITQNKLMAPGQPVDETMIKYLQANLLKFFDKHLLPHIGLAADSRHKKLRFLGHLFYKLLLVEMGIVQSTDRDSLKNKRINAAGRAYAKSFKTQFNLAIIQPVKKKFSKNFKDMPFSQVPLAQSFKTAINGPDLEKAMIQAIVTGNKELTIKNKQMPNRLASEILHRKNQLNFLSTLRVIRTPTTSSSKQDQRSDEMRRVHPSYTAYICPIQSADTGDQVGMVKQLALGATLLESTSSEFLKDVLLRDPEIMPLDRIFPNEIHAFGLTKITVNGDWIGCCVNSPRLIRKYREIRRGYRLVKNGAEVKRGKGAGKAKRAAAKADKDNNNKKGDKKDAKNMLNDAFEYLGEPDIDRFTTIYWDTESNEINFWCDAGRMCCPLMVVRNNGELDSVGRSILGTKYDAVKDPQQTPEDKAKGMIPTGCFVQDILLTLTQVEQLLRKGLTTEELHKMGVVDFITPDEMENCLVAPSLDTLKENQCNALKQYTHCIIPPAMMGLPALTCPYANHNQVPRIVFQTNQVKQTCGWYSLNYPDRIDKHATLQYYCEMPVIKTLANKYLYPNGYNTIVAIAAYGGFNQEDSLIFNTSAAQRGMYKCIHFNFLRAELEKDEKFGNPNESNTEDIKHAKYEHLVNGMVKRGTILHKDDGVIGKLAEIKKPTNNKLYKDTSIIYSYNEPGMVENVVRARNQDEDEFCKVKFSNVRTLGIGDKFSSRAGQKGVTGMGYSHANTLFTSSGVSPGITMSPHAIPSRMTIGQLIEGIAAKLAATKGAYGDATIFKKVDLQAIGDELEKYGFDRHGTEQMFNGMTGEYMDCEIFITPCYYQRLQKFVIDEVYSISTGPTCAITRQPLDGKANKGGLRIGEMEKDCIISHGASHFLMEKFRDDSDGFDIYVCRTCSKRPVVNEDENIQICKTCESAGLSADVVKVRSTWSSKLFMQELESCNVGVQLSVEPYVYEIYE